MDIKEQIKLRFKGVDFPEVKVSSIKPYHEKNNDVKLQIEIQPRVFIPKEEKNKFKILMKIDIGAKDFFSISVTAIGSFELSEEDVTDETRNTFINANSTAIVFPYLRAFISTLTSNLGNVTSPISLPTRFFKGDYLKEFKEDNSETNQ